MNGKITPDKSKEIKNQASIATYDDFSVLVYLSIEREIKKFNGKKNA